jgi:hypothetical protein
LVFLAIGVVGGIIAGVGAVLIWDRIDPRVRHHQRFLEVSGSSPIVARNSRDAEPFRKIVRAVLAGIPGKGRQYVAVYPVRPAYASEMIDAVSAALTATGVRVRVLDTDSYTLADIDRGWPRVGGTGLPRASAHEIVLIDASAVNTWTRRAALADHMAASIVVASVKSRSASLKGVLSSIEDSQCQFTQTILIERVSRVPRKSPVAASTAAAEQPEQAEDSHPPTLRRSTSIPSTTTASSIAPATLSGTTRPDEDPLRCFDGGAPGTAPVT